jgi:hypothetical protein
MKRLICTLLPVALATPAWAIDTQPPPNVTSTSWEIYGFVAVAFLVGFAWVAWQQKKEKEREKRRASKAATGR